MRFHSLFEEGKITRWEYEFLENMEYNIRKFRYTEKQYACIVKLYKKVGKPQWEEYVKPLRHPDWEI
jgi:hypothetical protein